MQGTLVCPRCTTANIALGSPGCPSCGVQFAPAQAQVAPVFQPSGSAVDAMPADAARVTYAHMGHRFVSGCIDALLLAVPFMLLYGFETGEATSWSSLFDLTAWTVADWVELAIGGVYFVALMSTAGEATVGMRVMKLRIVRNGTLEPISATRALGWWSASLISQFFLFGYFFMLFTERKQALHDLMADTVFLRETN